MDFLAFLEQSSFSVWIRTSSSVFAYPFFLFLHAIGMGIVVGFSSVLALRILGFAPRVPLPPMERLFPVVWVGFWINTASGLVLLASAATTRAVSGVFWIKMVLIALALVNGQQIRKRVFRDPLLENTPVPMRGKALALASLFLWAGAITAGRLMAYIGASSLENEIKVSALTRLLW